MRALYVKFDLCHCHGIRFYKTHIEAVKDLLYTFIVNNKVYIFYSIEYNDFNSNVIFF